MDDSFSTFFEVADCVADLLEDPETAKRWEEPSALQGLSVGGLAAHLMMGVAYVHRLLDGPEGSAGPIVSVGEYVAGMKMEDFDADLHRYIRDKNERSASHGPERTIGRFRELVSTLRDRLRTESGRRLLDMRPTLPWTIALEDRLRLQVLDFVVHADDLAVSISRPGGHAPEPATSVAIDALVAAARFQHGDKAVIRALSRRERSTPGVFPVL
jgi:mycothiol maleylpyruvate isomerase-like protein